MPMPDKLILSPPYGGWLNDEGGLRFRPFVAPNGMRGRIIKPADGVLSRAPKPGVMERATGRLASRIAIGPAEWESQLEKDAFLHLEFSKNIKSYRVQPYIVEYDGEGRTIRTYPDIERIDSDGTATIIQIKLKKTYDKHLENPRFRNEGALFQSFGWKYRVLTEVEIRIEPRLSNLKLLFHYRRRLVDSKVKRAVVEEVQKADLIPIHRLVGVLVRQKVHQADIIALIAQHELTFDLDGILGPETLISLPAQ